MGERTCIRLGCDLSDEPGTVYTTWFDKETFLPLKSEIAVDGEQVFEVTWSRFEITERGETGDGADSAEMPEEAGTTAS